MALPSSSGQSEQSERSRQAGQAGRAGRPARPGAVAPVAPSSRDKILDTAESLFARGGYEGVGLREVARLSGLSKSALFHHFPSKLELYAAVLDRILGDLLETIRPLSPTGPALPRLRALVEAIVDALAGSPTRAPLLLRTLFEGELLDDLETPEADAKLARIIGLAMQILRDGAASGELRPVPAPHAVQALIGMLVFHFASGPFGDEVIGAPVCSAAEIRRFREVVVEFAVNGLAAHPAGA